MNLHTPLWGLQRVARSRGPALMLATLALGAALTACSDDQPNPLAPSESVPSAIVSATGSASIAAMLSGDAVTRILPALQKDAAVPVGRALKDLDAKLRDAASSVAVRDRVRRAAGSRVVYVGT